MRWCYINIQLHSQLVLQLKTEDKIFNFRCCRPVKLSADCFYCRPVGLPVDADAGRGLPSDAGDKPHLLLPRQQCGVQDPPQAAPLLHTHHR